MISLYTTIIPDSRITDTMAYGNINKLLNERYESDEKVKCIVSCSPKY